MPDIRIHIIGILLDEPSTGMSATQIRHRLEYEGFDSITSPALCQKLKQMSNEGYIHRVNVLSPRRKYTYRLGSRPLWGQYDMFRMNETRYKILSLASKRLERREIADILAREGITPRETYLSMVKMYNHGWVRMWNDTVEVTHRGQFVLTENRLIAAHNLRGKVREFHSLSPAKTEGISVGGIPS